MGYQPRAAGLSGLGSTDNAIVRTNGTAGTSAQGSLVTIDDSGNVAVVGLSASSNTTVTFNTSDQTGVMLKLTNSGDPSGSQQAVYQIGFSDSRRFNIGSAGDTVGGAYSSRNYILSQGGTGMSIITAGGSEDFRILPNGSLMVKVSTGGVEIGRAVATDTTLSIGAASGMGGGVLALNGISAAPTTIAGQGTICVLSMGMSGGPEFLFDRPLQGEGTYLTDVPGTLTIDSGWAAYGSLGNKANAVNNYSGSGISGTMAAALELVSAGLGTALQQDEARIKELIDGVQAIKAALCDLLAPNQKT